MQLGKYPALKTNIDALWTHNVQIPRVFLCRTGAELHFDEKITSTRLENMNGEYQDILCLS